MVRKVVIGAIASVVVAASLVGLAWAAGWLGGRSSTPPPPVSPVQVSFGTCQHLTGHWEAYVATVSEERPYGDYEVSLKEVPTSDQIVDRATVRPYYIGGNGDESLFYDDNDEDGMMSVGDDLYVGSFGTGPYDVTLYWGANGATVAAFRCS